MKKIFVLVMAVGLVMVLGGVAIAGDTNTLTVSASVSGVCKFNSTTSALGFGALDPSLTGDATATTNATYWCTKGTTASVSAGNGSNYSGGKRRMAQGTEYIPYQLDLTGGTQTGLGKGTALTLKLDGTIANADYVNALVGGYSDTVTLSITP